MISINMTKAKDIWRDRIRQARQDKLAALDVQFMRAVESGNLELQQEISAKKQWFRDLPSATEIESAETVEDLKAFWSEELN